MRTGIVKLPEDVSGLTLSDRNIGLFVVGNRAHHHLRRRFSFAHEYAHVVVDRDRAGLVSRTTDRDDLVEVRANAFAAGFLMPEEGVRQFIAGLGKGKPSRAYAEVFDEAGSVNVEGRSGPGTQAVQLYDVVQIAHHFEDLSRRENCRGWGCNLNAASGQVPTLPVATLWWRSLRHTQGLAHHAPVR